jgi:alpha-L-fucosidase
MTIDERFPRSTWFRRDRFGLFLHWGLYAIPARGEWVRSIERLTVGDYQPFFDAFDPTAFDPRTWAREARQAGMKYAVLTAKHHDGFCLFDSRLTDYKSTNTKAGRDLVREYLDAFRAEGLKVGLYYSLLDWHHPDYPHFGDAAHPLRDVAAEREVPRDFDRYVDYLHGQVRELCTGYGKLDLLWFDFSYGEMRGEKWRAAELMRMVRELQPDVLVDNRLETSGEGFGSLATDAPTPWSGDFVSPEQILPPEGIRNTNGEPIPWEACITMNRNWGYAAGDKDFKPASMVVRKLVECVAKGGNLLLNVGPDANGRFPRESQEILAEVGEWMERNGASLHGCGAAGLGKPEWGWYTRKGNAVYAHVLETPIGGLFLPGIPAERVASIRLLADGAALSRATDWKVGAYPDATFVDVHPVFKDCRLPDPTDTVIEIVLKD